MDDEDYYEDCYDSDQYNDVDYDETDDNGDDDIVDYDDGDPCSRKVSSKVITKECLLAAQKEDLQRVMDLLSLGEHHARTLLIHYRWDVQKVFGEFAEKGKDRLYAEACLPVQEYGDHSSMHFSSDAFCEICMDKVPGNNITTMDCGHCYCDNCWTEHFIVKINEGQSRRIRCMAYKCNAICDEGKIRNLVSARDPDLAEKFERFLLESYIEDNKMVKWCPSVPHCGNAIRVDDDEYCEVECACGLQFCFSCSSEVHSPCSCLMWDLWTRKCKDESETVNWITVNTKQCPKCHKAVEKNGGCNLVRCICGQAFCWLCGGATGIQHTWTSIADHTCGRFKEEYVTTAARARSELLRYIHYHDRYKAHTDSLKAEITMKEKLKEKILGLEARQLELRDFSWVTNGAYRLFRSRRIISYSYPFAYYMFGDTLFSDSMTKDERQMKQNLFENQQQQLEANVEKLSHFLEEPFDDYPEEKVSASRRAVMDLSRIIDNLCKELYNCIENDLLWPASGHFIAPYRSKGVDKAEQLDYRNSSHLLS